jgi:hypothetical protein
MVRRYIDCYHEIGVRASRGEKITKTKLKKIKEKWKDRKRKCK